MTDYNDGNWHGWNGGECPVHPESEVEVIFSNSFGELMRDARKASGHLWNPEDMRKAETFVFRVVKAHREPREFWVTTREGNSGLWAFTVPVSSVDGREIIHVREVIE